MSDGFELPPRLGPGVVGQEAYEADREQHMLRGSLGTAFTPSMLGSAFADEPPVAEKPKRKRTPKPAPVSEETVEVVTTDSAEDDAPDDADEALEEEEEEAETPILPA